MADFGNTTMEASTGQLSNNMLGTGYAATQDGDIASITAYLNPTGTTRKAKFAIYSTSDVLLGYTSEITLSAGSGWYTAPLVSNVTVTNTTTYRLIAWADGSFQVTIARASQSGVGRLQALTYTTSFPNPASTTTNNFRYSIYATYDSGGGTTGQMKVYTGGSFTAKPVKVWDGSSWVVKPVKYWNGSTWVVTPY